MSGKERGSGPISAFLDRLFGDKVRVILIALAVAVAAYVLALIFGDAHWAEDAMIRPVIFGVFGFGGMCLVLGFQLVNPFCSAKAMDLAELFFVIIGGGGFAVWFVLNGSWMLFTADAYQAATMIAAVSGMWCALCLIHNARH